MSVETMASVSVANSKARSSKSQSGAKQRKKSVAETCRDTVSKIEQSLWSYRDAAGEEWDAQPACFITDYLLALQCFAFAVYVALFASNEDSAAQQQPAWYLIYFVALGISAAFGGLLHHVAFEAMRGFKDKKTDSLVQRARVFGFNFKRSTVDGFIDILWRIVLGFSILTNFALLSLAASRYLDESWAYSIIIVAGALYIALAIWASINMHVLFLFVGYLPPMIFGAVTSMMAFDWQWSHPSNEMLVYVLKLGSGLVQGLIVSPSKSSFNHNALSHVILSLAATFMLVHFKLLSELQGNRQASDTQLKETRERYNQRLWQQTRFIKTTHRQSRVQAAEIVSTSAITCDCYEALMLLFGGNLSGATKKTGQAHQQQKRSTDGVERSGDGGKDPLDKKHQTDDQQNVMVSPRTDVLHRLTNHELRLLEELERTRSKLQAEWRHKIADLQQNGNNTVPSVEQLVQQFSPPSTSPKKPEDLKAMMRNKTLVRKSNQSTKLILKHKKLRPSGPARGANISVSANSQGNNNLPLLRTNLDILPVLTSSGETPFEVGLDAGSSPMQQQQQHVLPIFRLPNVNPTATASVLAVKEVEVLEEDRERKQASEALGLTLEEIATLEAELNGDIGSHSSSQQQISTLSPGHSDHSLQDKKLPSLNQQSYQVKAKKATHQKREPKWKHNSSKDKERPSKEDIQVQRSDDLRKELESALSSVQHLTRLVKDDIVFAQKICPANELRTSLYFKRWGRDKVENIFRRLLFNLQGIAFQKWNQVVAHEKQEEKLQAYLMYKGSKKLDHFLLNWSQRKLRQAWTKWWSDIAHVKAIERLTLELDAIRVLQRAWRGYCGRMFASLVKRQKLFAEQTAGAIKIQRMFRGSVTRKFFRLKQLNKHRQQAATTIQACGRGYLARQLVKQMRLERKRFKAASKIQALHRGRKARREVAVMRRNCSVTRAALVIQRRYRGRLGRVKFLRKQIERYRGAAATKIQKIARGRIARRILRDLKAKAAQQKALEHASAIKIQKVYRGHRSRLSTELKLIALREKNRWRAKAATRIQKIMRSYLAKRSVRRLRQEHVTQLVVLARTWAEYWSEDTSMWFYYNQETGEAIWAPPSSGYTKADGNLVLQTGKVISDPLDGDLSGLLRDRKKPSLFDKEAKANGNADEAGGDHHKAEDDNEDDDEDKLCVECEEEDARRRCHQCEDVFCDACYEKLHRSSKREKHTWRAMGSLRCIECEKMKATRWCFVCQDPYCLGCFTIIHSKGNKVSHEWTDMSTFRKATKQQQQQQMYQQLTVKEEEDTQTYDEFMQSHEYQYVTELVAEESAPMDYSNAMANGAEGEWMTLLDESSGQTYYYNSYTGESRWA